MVSWGNLLRLPPQDFSLFWEWLRHKNAEEEQNYSRTLFVPEFASSASKCLEGRWQHQHEGLMKSICFLFWFFPQTFFLTKFLVCPLRHMYFWCCSRNEAWSEQRLTKKQVLECKSFVMQALVSFLEVSLLPTIFLTMYILNVLMSS